MDDFDTLADQALAALQTAGFEHAQVTLRRTQLTELNFVNNEAGLMRSMEHDKLALVGLHEGRRAATMIDAPTGAGTRGQMLEEAAARLFADAAAAPADEANAVSAWQWANIEQGPQQPEPELIVAAARDLLAWRAEHTPGFMLSEGTVSHQRRRQLTLTTGGSRLAARIGEYQMVAVGAARDGEHSSSFSYAGGDLNELRGVDVARAFGIGEMMRSAVASTHPQPLSRKFVGDVVLTPEALGDVLGWLLTQLGDERLISDSSLYRQKVGKLVASPLLTVKSRFDGPGVAAISADGFATPARPLLHRGVLQCLLPTLYGSRRTGVPHAPVPAEGGWEVAAGDTPLAQLADGLQEGAWVGRFSMGRPGASGDFSGVIKNSFLIEGGVRGPALSETMVAGNMAQMLQDVVAVSQERVDYGGLLLPWVRVRGMSFS